MLEFFAQIPLIWAEISAQNRRSVLAGYLEDNPLFFEVADPQLDLSHRLGVPDKLENVGGIQGKHANPPRRLSAPPVPEMRMRIRENKLRCSLTKSTKLPISLAQRRVFKDYFRCHSDLCQA